MRHYPPLPPRYMPSIGSVSGKSITRRNLMKYFGFLADRLRDAASNIRGTGDRSSTWLYPALRFPFGDRPLPALSDCGSGRSPIWLAALFVGMLRFVVSPSQTGNKYSRNHHDPLRWARLRCIWYPSIWLCRGQSASWGESVIEANMAQSHPW